MIAYEVAINFVNMFRQNFEQILTKTKSFFQKREVKFSFNPSAFLLQISYLTHFTISCNLNKINNKFKAKNVKSSCQKCENQVF
jgi:hypothetical protein